MSLTIQEMQEKIERVEEDIAKLQSQGEAGRKLEVLIEYKNYLKDELEFNKREKQQENNRQTVLKKPK